MFIHTFSVCAYKDSPYLKDCLASLTSQTLKCASQIIICTSTPSEYIANLAQKFGCPLFINDANPGIATDWNFAIQSADTPFVTIAHQDDIYCPEYAEHAISLLSNSSHPLVFFSDYGELRNGEKIDSNRLLKIKRKMLKPLQMQSNRANVSARRRALAFGSPICCPAVTFAVNNLPTPIFQVGLKGSLDWEAWERISKMDGDFIFDANLLMYHRIHEESETTALIRDKTRTNEDLEMFSRFWPRPIARIINKIYAISQKSNG